MTEYITRRMQLMFKRLNPTIFFKNFFIPSKILEWNKLDQEIRNAKSYTLFRKHILSFIRPEADSIFSVHNRKGKKLTRPRVGFSHLKNTNFDITFKMQ